uniref:Phosducin thioredoxin-like domain-containing protein n=1 Tax=Corethron hystrix TaxID=216773 RepID=A0A7S1BYH2_9STRA|mmetsp:Transcript_4522/g.8793  ORF Transcript_4522/g.8793 Transcript_4522/m.8793 type:complete len:416 (+) Transcript_4522:144-1391(+)
MTSLRNLEGLGGPIDPMSGKVSSAWIDPTLQSCCARDLKEAQAADAIESTLREYDRVAAAEREARRLRNLASMPSGQACRCCYDVDKDGGEYWELMQWRKNRDAELKTDDVEDFDGGALSSDAPRNFRGKDEEVDEEESDDESDDEFDYLLDEEIDGLNSELESARRSELLKSAHFATVRSDHGYGIHRQIGPSRAVANARSCRASVLHLFDPTDPRCPTLDLILEDIAPKYTGTRFVRGDATDRAAAASIARIGRGPKDDADVGPTHFPALVAFIQGNAVASMKNLEDLGRRSGGDIQMHEVENWLYRTGALQDGNIPEGEYYPEGDLKAWNTLRRDIIPVCSIRIEEDALFSSGLIDKRQGSGYRSGRAGRNDEDAYECGVAGCVKHFAHQHVGVTTEGNSGLVLREGVEEKF